MTPPDRDDEPEPTEEELRAAAELAHALDGRADPAPGSDAAFASALRATRSAAPKLEDAERERVVARAMTKGTAVARSRSRARWLAIAAAALVAIAIPAGLALTGGPREVSGVVAPSIGFGGPTDAIFGGPFEDDQRASDRMDRIASTRAHDYFAAIAAGAR